MATRKTNPQPSRTKIDHNCSRDQQIGEITGRLDAQESTDQRIENSLNELVKNYNADQQKATSNFGELKCEIARIGTALESSAKTSEQLISNQTELLKQMSDIAKLTGSVQSSQNSTHDMLEKHLNESSAWRVSIERRIGKLERIKWFWYSLAVGAAGLIGVLAYGLQFYERFAKK